MVGALSLQPGEHVVHFYTDDDARVDSVVRALASALTAGQAGIVVVPARHRPAVLEGLRAHGIDGTAAAAAGSLVWRDPAELAADLLVDGTIDPDRFESSVGELVRQVVARHGSAHVYGEIVSELWSQGHVVAALELERLWNVLLAELPVSLMCGYPYGLTASSDDIDDYQAVCAEHHHVLGGSPVAPGAATSRRFPGTPRALRHARRFVAEVLHGWGLGHLEPTATLVVNELATNAVEHARSDFTVSLGRSDGEIRVSVGDRQDPPLSRRPSSPSDVRGRGLLLVDALCAGSGHLAAPGGKLVWGDIAVAGEEPP
jgi:anti-sigma regulatory factor (Ser/Thr protein kinase)